ncbi:GNAT family N-acetyltransferase [Roseibacterium sp. SDUM158016]|uniref:GNAT family N-acetyltransferase n=1 Tax=Roseicyclus sediminis TaxID=2980997 RepID=UPI0021D0A2AE|nr:GNAT family N-acetyltransferase [Roseibacterium sp. SDUM158016]MCU4651294.1 GNAT family N-acetyltransferase [Roseibacterium sp. SDUM158016]
MLRAPAREDFAAYEAFMLSDRSHLTDRTPRKVWHLFAVEFFGWCLDGLGHWVIERRDGRPVGVAGFSHPSYYPEPEMGWALYDGFEGRGYATEAARAARDWARDRLASLVSYIASTGVRSIAVAERLGAVRDDEAVLPEGASPKTCLVYRHWGSA